MGGAPLMKIADVKTEGSKCNTKKYDTTAK